MTINVVVGGGITGLVGALLLKKKDPNTKLYIIEKESSIGGLLRSYKYENGLIFDHGMHNTNETGIKELDEILYNILKDDWNILSGINRDLAGSYFNHSLQLNSIYPDINDLLSNRPEIYNQIFKTIEKNIDSKAYLNAINVEEYSLLRFGKSITNLIYKPILEKIFYQNLKDLHPLAISLIPLDRVILFKERMMEKLIDNDLMRDYFAYPEQRNLPLKFSSKKNSLYPKHFGSYHIVESIERSLKEMEVQIITSSTVEGINLKANNITNIDVKSEENIYHLDNIKTILWTVGLPQIYKILKFPKIRKIPDKSLNTYIANFMFDKEINCSDLQYLHCYCPLMKTFRVNNYYNYCPKSKTSLGFPVTSELIYDKHQDLDSVLKDSLNDLKRMNLCFQNKINFQRVEKLESGFPTPTVNNISIISDMSKEIVNNNIRNLKMAGILSNERVFFQRHVLPDLYKTIME